MALGKIGAFLNKDLGALAKDAGKVLNTDLGTIAKGAGRVLQSDLGDLLRDSAGVEKPTDKALVVPQDTVVPAAKQVAAGPPTVTPPFAADSTQKMAQVPAPAPLARSVTATPSASAAPFDPQVTQILKPASAAAPQPSATPVNVDKSATAQPAEPTKFNQELLVRTQRTAPVGTDVKVLLPYSVGYFERPRATPSGELTNDPVNAAYAGRGESVLVQLAFCWDADEALQLVKEVITQIGLAARAPPDHTWVIGPTKQGVVYAWTRDCYFFCATSPKGGPALARFLSAYEY